MAAVKKRVVIRRAGGARDRGLIRWQIALRILSDITRRPIAKGLGPTFAIVSVPMGPQVYR